MCVLQSGHGEGVSEEVRVRCVCCSQVMENE